jgi:hypothetical protein
MGGSKACSPRRIVLPGGTLEVATEPGSEPLDALCDFAVRNNARRGFLIVSRVLGRHLPVAPGVMQAAFTRLAATVPADLPGPVLFIGMAETAVALGQAVHAAYRARSGRTDTLFLHTTRQLIDAQVIARFEEPHSHASAHLVYAPEDAALQVRLADARSLVMVDDEATTGTTLANLAKALAPLLPRLARLHGAVLADWSGGRDLAAGFSHPAAMTSLLRGTLYFSAAPDLQGPTPGSQAPAPTIVFDRAALGQMVSHRNFGRLGVDDAVLNDLQRFMPVTQRRERFLVLGTGEFVYPPFRLAAALEAQGHEVLVQATTRSPIHLGGAIGSVLRFADNYGTDVPNFLYNVVPEPGRRVLICHETPAGSVDPALIEALGAETIAFGRDA